MTLLAIATVLLALLSLRLYLRNVRLVARLRRARSRCAQARAQLAEAERFAGTQLVRSFKRRAALVRVARYCRETADTLDVSIEAGVDLAMVTRMQIAARDAAIEALTARIAELMPRSVTPFEMVREFHAKVGQADSATPDISQHRDLRVSLITEEFRELREALEANDIVEVADALADLLYVVVGSALQWGIPLERVVAEVHRSNMTKGGDAKRADGKILKGPNYSPPDIAGVLGPSPPEPAP